jgi:hypothetical protein
MMIRLPAPLTMPVHPSVGESPRACLCFHGCVVVIFGFGPGNAQPATPAQPPPVAADDEATWTSQLRKLAQLHDEGILSDAHYEAAKRRIIQQE